MKRLLVIMVMVVLFVAPTHAESIDLESMSTDELLALRNQINSILTERVASDASVIYSGNYTVGTDIKAGRYVFVFDKLVEGYTYGELIIYANAEAKTNRERILENLRIGEEYYLDLSDDMIIEISLGSGTLRGIPIRDWAP